MNILVVNAGSSSLKYQLLDMDTGELLAKGLCERVGYENAVQKHRVAKHDKVIARQMRDHRDAIGYVLNTLINDPDAPISDLSEIHAVGHRIVSGGEFFSRSCLVDDDVIEKIAICSELAPLHNPGALQVIDACRLFMPHTPQVTVFDTAYFQSIPPKAFLYGLPLRYYEKYKIRKYGAHGTSHRYVAARAAQMLGKPLEELKLITCHLGNGSSVTAVDKGVAVDTSMGMTPLDGLIMGTRCGSVDPAVITYIMRKESLTPDEMENIMNRESGLYGISGLSNDLREIRREAEMGNERANLAYEMFGYAVKKYIGQYFATMAGCDAIILTAGIGENCTRMPRMIFDGLEPMGIIYDPEKNCQRGMERVVSSDESRIKILVIPTNEEWMIAQDTKEIVEAL